MRSVIRISMLTCLASVLGIAPFAHGQSTPPAQTPGVPQLQVERNVVDLGNRWIDQPLTCEFRLRNKGAADLIVSNVVSPTDVSARMTPQQSIAPNGEATVQVTIKPNSLAAGDFEKQVTLLSNDPHSPQTILRVRGHIKHYLDVVPYAVGFGKLDGDGQRERRITIRNHAERPVKLTMDESSLDKKFHYELVETMPGREFELYVDSRPPFEPGTYRGEIHIKTDLPSQPQLDIGVFAIMPERVEVMPRVISFSTAADGVESAPTTHVLNVESNGDKPVHVVEAHCSDKAVGVNISEIFPGRKYRLLVKLPANYTVPETGASVLIKTDDAEFPLLTVTIGASSRRSAPPRQVTRNTQKQERTAPPRRKRRPVLETIGKPAPSYDLKTMEGFPVTNQELTGHPATVLNFFAPNCPHCKKQLPKVEQVRLQFEPLGVRFVNVSERMRKDFTPDEVMAVVSDLGANAELAIDAGNQVGRRFKATGYPCLIVIDPKGVIHHVVSGNKKNLVADVSEKLESLLTADSNG